jgi:hypothetical protein
VRPPFSSEIFERAQEYIDRRRLRIGLCAAVAVALIAALVGLLTSDGGGRSVRTAEFAKVGPTTTVDPGAGAGVGVVNPLDTAPAPGAAPGAVPGSPTTTTPALVLGTTFTRPTTTAAPKAAPKAATPATTAPPAKGPPPTCRNSYDPACGSFRWDPDPGPNQPMTGQITFDPPNPRAGDTVTFHIVANDPDAQPVGICNASYGQGEAGYVCDPRPKIDPSYCPAQYGPWTPPGRQTGNLDTTDRHLYKNAGSYDVSFDLGSAQGDCNNPYASGLTVKTTVIVTP